MTDLASERFYPAEADEVFAALQLAALELGRIKLTDDFTRTITIQVRPHGLSWGSRLMAQVRATDDGGALVRVDGMTRVRTNLTAKSSEFKLVGKLLDLVSIRVQEFAADG